MVDLVFFDFDGVLVESIDIKTKAFRQLFLGEGEDIADRVVEYHLNNAGVSRYEKFRHIYKDFLARPLTDAVFSDLCMRFSELVIDEVVKAPFVRGAEEFLREHSSRYSCFIVSATPQEEIKEIVKRRKMASYFRGVYGAPKKKADMVRDVLSSEAASPARAVYIGDAFSDYTAAEENHVKFIARIHRNESIFTEVNCLKIADLIGLKECLDSIS